MHRLFSFVPVIIIGAVLFLRSIYASPDINEEFVDNVYAKPATIPEGPLSVFHLGHSLVGRDMPAMLAQLAPEGHRYDSQLGWGTSLKEHWQGRSAINGFDVENDHPRYRDAKEAVGAGDYSAVVLTEMVELKDAIKYHDSSRYLHRWADLARSSNEQSNIYLYESWHHLNDEEGWLARIDSDLDKHWLGELVLPELAKSSDLSRPIFVIPAGQVMAAFVRRVDAVGGVGNIASRESLFARDANGNLDTIHLNDLGHYLVALTHYAVLYQRSPEGLPYALTKADGTLATAPSPEAAALMQETVWQVVQDYVKSGVPQ